MSEFLDVAEEIFKAQRKPMSATALVDYAIKEQLFSDKIAGATPHQTMKAKLSVDIRKKDTASRFVRTAPGKFYLRALVSDPKNIYEAKPLRPPNPKENVLTFPSALLSGKRNFQGVNKKFRDILSRVLTTKSAQYLGRITAEQILTHKQVLTYILLTRKSSVLAFRRGNYNRVANFLRGRDCVGFGGHVSEADVTLFSEDFGITENAIRELKEELKLPPKDIQNLSNNRGLRIIGVLNDDSSEIGQRHFAVILQYEVSNSPEWIKPERGEKSITRLRWLGYDSKHHLADFEYWSQLCLRSFFPTLSRSAPAFKVVRKQPFRKKHVLCLLGGVGSGKSEATRTLVREFGYHEINTGRLVAELIGVPPVPQTSREEFQKVAWKFITSKKGPVRLAKAILHQMKGRNKILVDGVRQKATLDALIRSNPSIAIVKLFVHTPPDLAYEFWKIRERGSASIQDFLKVRGAPVEREVEEMIGDADAVLYNWIGREGYIRAIRELMAELEVA